MTRNQKEKQMFFYFLNVHQVAYKWTAKRSFVHL